MTLPHLRGAILAFEVGYRRAHQPVAVRREKAPFFSGCESRPVWVRGHENVRKRVLIQAAACNIGLLLRRQTGVGKPRSLQGRALSAIYGLIGRWRGCLERLRWVWGLKRAMLHLEAA